MEQAATAGVNSGLWGAVIVFGILLAICIAGLLISTRRAEENARRTDMGDRGHPVRPGERSAQVRHDEARPEAQAVR